MVPHSSTLAWKIPWTEEPGRLQSMGSWRVRHDCVTSLSLFTFMHWRGKWQPTPVFLPGKSHGQRRLVGYSPWGREESDTTEWFHFPFSLSCIGERNGNPLHCPCLENPRDGKPGGLPSMGSQKVGHDWSVLAAAAAAGANCKLNLNTRYMLKVKRQLQIQLQTLISDATLYFSIYIYNETKMERMACSSTVINNLP